MNKHFATVVVVINGVIIIGLLGLRGWLPPVPEKTEVVEERRLVAASRCRQCTPTGDLLAEGDRLDEPLDDNARNVRPVITKINLNPPSGTCVWLETEHLLFRDIRLSDVDDFYAYCSNPEAAARSSWPRHHAKIDSLKVLKNWISLLEERRGVPPWAVEEKATGRLIGTAGISECTLDEPRGKFDYSVGQAGWNKGYELEIVRALLEYSIVTMQSVRTETWVRSDYIEGQRILEEAGLSKEGISPHYKLVDGQYVDFVHYALLTKEIAPNTFKHSVLQSFKPETPKKNLEDIDPLITF